MGYHVASNGTLSRDIITPGVTINEGASAGISSALLPFLKASKQKTALHQQNQRMVVLAPRHRTDNDYDPVLTLLGMGWIEERYKFERNGLLEPRWICAKN